MRQVWITKIGGPEVLHVKEKEDPNPAEGEVRIRVAAAGVNFADVMARVGLYPDSPRVPCVVGYEVSGTIDRVGPVVPGLAVGQRVLALTRFGGYSDVVCVSAKQVAPIPDSLSFEKAAAIPVNYLTAWVMLVHLGNVRAGDRVLVHAVAGGVGQAALQICNWKGAEVIGTSSGSKIPELRKRGVKHCIDYTWKDFEVEVEEITAGRGVDIVLDAVGGRSFRKSYRCLAPLGRLFLFGASSFSTGTTRSLLSVVKGLLLTPRFGPISLMNDNRAVLGVNLGHLWNKGDLLGAMMGEIVGLVRAGTFDPVVDQVYPFDRAGEAHLRLQERKNFGKVLLVPTAPTAS